MIDLTSGASKILPTYLLKLLIEFQNKDPRWADCWNRNCHVRLRQSQLKETGSTS